MQVTEDGGAAVRRLAAPPQQGADAGQQLLRLKGLGQVVVRAAVQTPHPIAEIAAGRQHQHRHRLAAGAELLQQGKAVQLRQHGVQQHQIVNAAAGVVQTGHAVIADIHGVAPPVQQLRQRVRQTLFILHDQNTHRQPSFFRLDLYHKRVRFARPAPHVEACGPAGVYSLKCGRKDTPMLTHGGIPGSLQFRPVSASVSNCTSDVSSMR